MKTITVQRATVPTYKTKPDSDPDLSDAMDEVDEYLEAVK